jgi:hypothetical protein
MGDNEVRNKVVTEFSSEGMLSFATSATGVAAALGSIALAQHLGNQALAAAAAPINTIIALNTQRESQLRSMTNALVAQQAIGGTRALQAVADAAAAGTGEFTRQQLRAGTQQWLDEAQGNAALAEGLFRRSATSAGVFQQAMRASQEMMRMMVTDAASLPGEVNDYATAMQIASSSVIQAVAGTAHSNTRAVMGMINNITASAINAGIDSSQAGRDIMRMMSGGRGQAGLDVRTWTEVIAPYARGRNGQQLDASQFNAQTAAQRFETLMTVGNNMRNIMNMSADSWDAVIGALSSARDELFRNATSPIYKAIQSGLSQFSAWLNEGVGTGQSVLQKLERMGNYISTTIVKWVDPFLTRMSEVEARFLPFVTGLLSSPWVATIVTLIERAAGAMSGLITQFLSNPLQALRTVISTINPLFGGFVDFLVTDGRNARLMLLSLIESGIQVGQALMLVVAPIAMLTSVVSSLWTQMGPLAAVLVSAIAVLSLGLGALAALVIGVIAVALMMLVPPVNTIISVFSLLADAVSSVVMLLHGLGLVIKAVWEASTGERRAAAHTLMEANALFSGAHRHMEEAGEAFIARMLNVGDASAVTGGLLGSMGLTEAQDHPFLVRMRALMTRLQDPGNSTALTSPSNRAVSSTHNDFRFSRFDITQRFAEGFDPDRIATFFQRDIANAANQRLEGGFAPAFTT